MSIVLAKIGIPSGINVALFRFPTLKQALLIFKQTTQLGFIPHCRVYSSKEETVMNIFDRKAKRIQRNRTALTDDYSVYQYLHEEIGWVVADRIGDVKRKFEVAANVGCGYGHVSKNIYKEMVGILYQCDMSENVLEKSQVSLEVPTIKIQADEEFLPFKTNSLDLVVSSLSMHWVNDLPGAFKQIYHALKNDGCFIGCMFGGDTLFELRVALQLAEQEKEGGVGVHISPFASAQDLGDLLNRAGFRMTTIDVDEMVIRYPSMSELMADLKGMGENNAAWCRKPMLQRETMKAADIIYKDMYGKDGGKGIPASFQIIHFIGWKPDPSQAQTAMRGSAQVSIKDIDKLDEIEAQLKQIKKSAEETFEKPMSKLAQDIEKLRQHTTKIEQEDDDKTKK